VGFGLGCGASEGEEEHPLPSEHVVAQVADGQPAHDLVRVRRGRVRVRVMGRGRVSRRPGRPRPEAAGRGRRLWLHASCGDRMPPGCAHALPRVGVRDRVRPRVCGRVRPCGWPCLRGRVDRGDDTVVGGGDAELSEAVDEVGHDEHNAEQVQEDRQLQHELRAGGGGGRHGRGVATTRDNSRERRKRANLFEQPLLR